ncbi:NAD-dependent formate dehydrogenase [Pseudoclavibacter chungangensis]|uniref:Formate dehydrogenase n=1 Tax=Pseudoclavibacter chungangensis TaxID=587635 RepID=A0A7J5BNX1_9MICO|nr:NAD-dependent formate dehydrogenase [Pseudoclavibacter chungangensis]KAB1654290.1 NAD-dependent formate dehydrogenase [Pseudoclavibacter chungangensis]NYJ65304.1 lactate dehydrogenase-like 2-hydroxyacid dehydrogenase/DNA-binding transcriptional LysR family regulator [Pseudoclavibacter chungangensis]
MAKIVLVLYPDPKTGYPPVAARDSLPVIEQYPNGQSLPTPEAIDFKPGELLGSVSDELGLRAFLEAAGHELVVTSDKDGPDSAFERELADADVVISQPFWPAYLTCERIAKAPNLKLAVTAGIGSDHVDLDAAIERDITVAEVTYSNSIGVAEHTVLQVLALVRDFVPQHRIVLEGGWDIADAVSRSYDLEGMDVGVFAAGRIGRAVIERLAPFGVHLHYTDRHRLPAEYEEKYGLTFHEDIRSLVTEIDVLTVHAPLTAETTGLIDDELLATMRRGAYIVNPARAAIADRDAIVRALESGQLAGYAGDVWFPQPAPADHPWRTMPHHAMTPHTSGTSLPSQARYAAGTREILEDFFAGRPIRPEYLIVLELGVPLVRRGRSFEGLTPEGEAVLARARRMLDEHRSLRDEVDRARDRLATTVRIGVIPAGLVPAADLVSRLALRHPLVRVGLRTGMTSEEIVVRLHRYELDAGLIHPSAADHDDLHVVPVHEDRIVAVAGAHSTSEVPLDGGSVTPSQLRELGLAMLDPGMRARQVIDDALRAAGESLTPRFEADSIEGLLALVRQGPWVALVPESTARSSAGLRTAALIEPDVAIPVVLARLADEPRSPVASAIDEAAAHDDPGRARRRE